MYKGLFITGTDTGVGKTYIAASLAHALRMHGVSVGVMKPLASGDREDAKKLIRAARVHEQLATVNPLFFRYPLAPLMAARIAGKKIDMESVWKAYAHFRRKYDFTIVEGVGGLMVPIRENYMVLDMIKKFALPVAIVARPYLGTINHTLLTVDKLHQKKIPVAGIILSNCSSSTLAEKTNPEIIRELTGLPVLEVASKKEVNLEQNTWLISNGR